MFLVFTITLIFSVFFALTKGGAPERLCAIVFVLMAALQYSGSFAFGRVFEAVDLVSLAVDLLGALAFTAVALVADRLWPLLISAMQLISCVSHFGREIAPKVEPLVYSVLRSGPTLAALVILAVGTILHQRRVLKQGMDASWISSFQAPVWLPEPFRH